MKTLYLFFLATVLCFFACNDDDTTCVASVTDDCFCTQEYDPVCGCDDVTYSNACHAACSSITEFTPGECP